VLGSTL